MNRKPTTLMGKLRRSRTLSQDEMARLLDVARQTYSKYELGVLDPPLEQKHRIAALLGVSVRELFAPPGLGALKGIDQ